MTLRIGCVPYLNAKPVVDWFHTPECGAGIDVVYAVPSLLARYLREGALDVALVSTVELFRAPGLRVVPGISISADGPVRSVRLFSSVPFGEIRSVALDMGSLTSVALTRIILVERFGVTPELTRSEPELGDMLSKADAALIIGRLDDFKQRPPFVLDLGEAWSALTGLPFCYAAWLAREGVPEEPMVSLLNRAKQWGAIHRGDLVKRWAEELNIPVDRVSEYLCRIIDYDLSTDSRKAIVAFQEKCLAHGITGAPVPIEFVGE